MAWRIIDITDDGRYLHASREWLIISTSKAASAVGDISEQTPATEKTELARVPFRDIQALIMHAGHGLYSHHLLLKLNAHNIPLVICDHKHMPVSCLWPLTNHMQQAGRLKAQMNMTAPTRKRALKVLIQAKIREQANTLLKVSDINVTSQDKKHPADQLKDLVALVKAGDPDNIEARAARLYWKSLFGPDFVRDQGGDGLNAHLNYGYIILRSALARLVVGAGLTPSLGVGHDNQRNNFALVDDFIEPFRPLVDRVVYENRATWDGPVTKEAKAILAGLMTQYIASDGGDTDLTRVMAQLVHSYVACCEGSARHLRLPDSIALTPAPQFEF